MGQRPNSMAENRGTPTLMSMKNTMNGLERFRSDNISIPDSYRPNSRATNVRESISHENRMILERPGTSQSGAYTRESRHLFYEGRRTPVKVSYHG